MADYPKNIVQSFLETWRAAFNRGDTTALAALYTPDAYFSGAVAGNAVGADESKKLRICFYNAGSRWMGRSRRPA